MIKSILDTDLYKFSVSFAYMHEYENAECTFKFNDRKKYDWREYPNFLDEMKLAVQRLANLSLLDDECEWAAKKIYYIPLYYWYWLKSFRFDPNKIKMWIDSETGVFNMEVTDLCYKCTLYETPLLGIYSAVRNKVLGYSANIETVKQIIDEKIEFANQNNLTFAEFGMRRRFNYHIQDTIVKEIKEKCHVCVGTSNVHLAMKYNMTPTGTYPHEWVMFHAGVKGFVSANFEALQAWIRVYHGYLGTALVDTYTTKSFLHSLTREQALLLSGFRQDSGDEIEVGNAIVKRLDEFHIDPSTKVIVFSNALDFRRYKRIHDYFMPNGGTPIIKVSAGIGTNLTCDTGIENYEPANIVMKMSQCRINPKDKMQKVIKISDDLGKHMGDPELFDRAKSELDLDI